MGVDFPHSPPHGLVRADDLAENRSLLRFPGVRRDRLTVWIVVPQSKSAKELHRNHGRTFEGPGVCDRGTKSATTVGSCAEIMGARSKGQVSVIAAPSLRRPSAGELARAGGTSLGLPHIPGPAAHSCPAC